jgi:TP901 family phage tail tape measure protein
MRNVNSITKQSEAQFADTSNQVLALSRTVPQSAATLAKGLYDIASSGFSGADGMTILKTSAIAATAGMTTADVSAKAITATLNAYGRQASDSSDISDVLFKTVEVGVITFEELASGMGTWIGMAAAAKVPVDEAAAAIAAMTLSGIGAAESGTALNRVMTALISPGEELTNTLAELGYESGAQALETDGLRGVMEKLRGATGGNITEMQALFPEVRALKGALALTANEGQNFANTFDQITDKTARAGAAEAAYAEQSKALSVQWDLTKSSMNGFAIEVGNRLLPILSSAAGFVGGLFDAFSGLPGPVITAVTALAGVSAIALTVGGTLLILAPRNSCHQCRSSGDGSGRNRSLPRTGEDVLRARQGRRADRIHPGGEGSGRGSTEPLHRPS